MRYIPYLIIACLIGWIIYDDGQDKEKQSQFETREDSLKTHLKALQSTISKIDLEALRMGTQLNVAKQDMAKQAQTIERINARYNVLKNMAHRNLSDSAINAEIARLYPPR